MRQDIEASVIGGLLIGGLTPTASDVLATLEPEAFSIPLYRKAFEVIRKQARNRNLIDALMVAEACGEEHFTSILMTSKNCPSAANLKGYAGMVADNYHRRLVLEIMDEMREPIQNGTIDTSSQAMDELVKRLSAIRKPRDEVKPVRLLVLLKSRFTLQGVIRAQKAIRLMVNMVGSGKVSVSMSLLSSGLAARQTRL